MAHTRHRLCFLFTGLLTPPPTLVPWLTTLYFSLSASSCARTFAPAAAPNSAAVASLLSVLGPPGASLPLAPTLWPRAYGLS